MTRLAIAAAMALGMIQAATAFDLDVPLEELLTRTDRLTVMDLAVGEIGIATIPTYCHEDGKLFAHGLLVLAESPSSFGPTTRFKRLPNSVFEITISAEGSDKPIEYWFANTGLSGAMTPCRMIPGIPHKVEIRSINNSTNLRSLLP